MQVPNDDFNWCNVMGSQTTPLGVEAELPCSVGVIRAVWIRFCAVGKEAWQKADSGE